MWRPKFFKIFKDFKSDNWRITFKSTTSNDVFDGRNWIELFSNRPLGRRKRSQNQVILYLIIFFRRIIAF